MCTLRRPGYSLYGLRMIIIASNKIAIGRIPQLDRLIFSTRGNSFSIWRPGYSKNSIFMPQVFVGQLASGCLPYLHRTIKAGRSDASTIRRPGNCAYVTNVTGIGDEMKTG